MDGANASQSVAPPRPPVNVTITVPPGTTAVELTDRIGAATIETGSAVDVPPLAGGENTVTDAASCQAISVSGIAALNYPELTYVVCRSLPFQRTIDDEVKLAPFTVSVNRDWPATTTFGESDVT